MAPRYCADFLVENNLAQWLQPDAVGKLWGFQALGYLKMQPVFSCLVYHFANTLGAYMFQVDSQSLV
jgi:hypothetical protein